MAVDVSDEPRITGYVGGQPKQKYWTPDGREILSAPSIHEYVYKNKEGNIIETGTRDANLDNGWLLQKPTELKPYCPHCDKWHDTQKGISQCGIKKGASNAKWQKWATREMKKENSGDTRIDKLENDMSEIKKLLKQLVEAK